MVPAWTHERPNAIAVASSAGLAIATLGLCAVGLGISPALGLAVALCVAAFSLAIICSRALPSRCSGANGVTALRLTWVGCLLAWLLHDANLAVDAGWALWLGVVALVADGVDGWLARRYHHESAAGARFDMETDAALILVLALIAWSSERAGGWVLLSGAIRYAFVAASWCCDWLMRPLPPSRRRQTVCIVQASLLVAAVSPVFPSPVSDWLAAIGLLALVWSFGVDVVWLWRQANTKEMAS
ncbi:MAG: CDP-alcohol phosphatidyltransferase family protein [Pseudomonadota bacterium]